MKYLRLRYIIPTILAVILVIFLGLYFIGGLSASAKIKYDNETMDVSNMQFDASQLSDSDLSNSVYVTENDKYVMYFDEKTTIIKIVSKKDNSIVYETADSSSDVAEEKSNVLLGYFYENGTINAQTLSTWANSIQYENKITGLKERHYKYSYLDDGTGVDVLYEIGNFVNSASYIPSEFDRTTFDSLFRGNLVFYTKTSDAELKAQTGNTLMLEYSGKGVTYSSECAAYLEENGLATVTEEVDPVTKTSVGAWNLDNLLGSDGRLKTKLGVDYNTTAIEGEEGYSPCTANPFTTSTIINFIYLTTNFRLESSSTDSEETLNTNPRQYVDNSSQVFEFRASSSTEVIKELLKYMYTINEYDEYGNQTKENYLSFEYRDSSGVKVNKYLYYDYLGNGELEKFKIGGFQAQDEDGRWLYDENGYPVQTGFTQEMAEEQNVLFGNDDAAKSTTFQLGLRFRLTDAGFKVTLVNNSLVEQEDAKFYQVHMLPYFTVNDDKNSDGQIIVPDGSGGIISFNSVKDVQNASTYEKKIYGTDYTIPLKEAGHDSETLMFGMYGFLDFTEKKGVVAIIDKGASQSWLKADFLRASQTTSYNYAKFITDLRTYESVSLNSGVAFNKWTTDIYPGDIVYEYRLLNEDELTYVDVANSYREYLLEKYSDVGLTEGGDTTTVHTPTLQFLGAFEKKVLTLGIVYNKDFALTTFSQAIEILEELRENGLENANVSYLYWTKDAVEGELTKNPKASSVLGGKKALSKLNDYLEECGFDFYPSADITMGRDYDYNFGSLKYSPKSVTSEYSTISQFVASTGLANSDFKPTVMLSSRFYEAYINKYLKKYSRYSIGGVYAWDLGNYCAGDYSKRNLTYMETAKNYQQNALEQLQENNKKIMLTRAFDYAIPYASVITEVPLTTTLLPCIDYSIPLYQLVISGLVDYSTVSINYENDNTPTWYFLKALETGSNLSFTLSAEDTKILLETNYTDNYGAYYLNWKYKIISLNKQLNDLGIYKSRLVSHEYVTDNVVKVEYANGLKLMINFDDDTYQDRASGLAIASNWYIVLEEGR